MSIRHRCRFPSKPNLAQERRRAKDLRKAVRRGDEP
jgi:hypothetical protein